MNYIIDVSIRIIFLLLIDWILFLMELLFRLLQMYFLIRQCSYIYIKILVRQYKEIFINVLAFHSY